VKDENACYYAENPAKIIERELYAQGYVIDSCSSGPCAGLRPEVACDDETQVQAHRTLTATIQGRAFALGRTWLESLQYNNAFLASKLGFPRSWTRTSLFSSEGVRTAKKTKTPSARHPGSLSVRHQAGMSTLVLGRNIRLLANEPWGELTFIPQKRGGTKEDMQRDERLTDAGGGCA